MPSMSTRDVGQSNNHCPKTKIINCLGHKIQHKVNLLTDGDEMGINYKIMLNSFVQTLQSPNHHHHYRIIITDQSIWGTYVLHLICPQLKRLQ